MSFAKKYVVLPPAGGARTPRASDLPCAHRDTLLARTLELFLRLARIDALEDAKLAKVLEGDLQAVDRIRARHVPPSRAHLLLRLPDRVAVLELFPAGWSSERSCLRGAGSRAAAVCVVRRTCP